MNDVMSNVQKSRIFMNRINWNAVSGEMQAMREFQADNCKFVFDEFLRGDLLTGFTEFAKDLRFEQLRSHMMLWVWLYQHGAKFHMEFGWNRHRSFFENMRNRRKPKELEEKLRSYGHDDLMACDLDELREQFGYPTRR